MGRCTWPKFTGMRRMGLAGESRNSNSHFLMRAPMKNPADQTLQFALCLDSEGYPASLEVGKLCRVVTDEAATTHGYIRIIDESGGRLTH